MLENQSEAHVRNNWDQDSQFFLIHERRMPLDLGMVVAEIITGGRNEIMQEAISETTGNQ